jgi:hypothetical protein
MEFMPGESQQEGNQDWDDIESELYCSAREACSGCFPSPSQSRVFVP